MRIIALSAIATLLIAGAAHAHEPVKLVLSNEPMGQPFTAAPMQFERIGKHMSVQDTADIESAKSSCAEWVAQIYSRRQQIYLACLQQTLDPKRFRITVLSDSESVAARFKLAN